jgi:hypothetical protein
VANQLRAGVAPASVTVQPWFENQVPLSGLKAIGVNGCAAATTSTRCLVNLSTVFTNGAVNTLVNQNAATINNARIAAGLAPLTTAPAQMTIPVTVSGNNGTSNYHGLLVTWRNNGWHGLTYDLNYTFSKALDNGLAAQANFPTAVNSFDPRSNYGFSTFDRTHIFNGLFRYNLPFGKDSSGINRLLGGWYISGITNTDSGLPLVITNTNSQGFGGGSSVSYIPTVPLSSLDVGYRSTSSGINYFGNPAAVAGDFRPIQLSTDTRTGRGYTLRGPKFWSVDSRIGKKTSITERMGAEFSADFFNLFNHPTFVAPTINLANPATFGSVASTFVPANRVNGARWIQFGLKLTF